MGPPKEPASRPDPPTSRLPAPPKEPASPQSPPRSHTNLELYGSLYSVLLTGREKIGPHLYRFRGKSFEREAATGTDWRVLGPNGWSCTFAREEGAQRRMMSNERSGGQPRRAGKSKKSSMCPREVRVCVRARGRSRRTGATYQSQLLRRNPTRIACPRRELAIRPAQGSNGANPKKLAEAGRTDRGRAKRGPHLYRFRGKTSRHMA